MVLINEKKYACATCIKGHRVSGCTHTDRPLFEVKKKGRPSTQCPTCRDRRKPGKSVHTKCACGSEKDAVTPPPGGTPAVEDATVAGSSDEQLETRKGQPGSTPSFPNGLKDVHELAAAADVLGGLGRDAPVAAERSVASLLNPCSCRTTGICRCCAPKKERPSPPPRDPRDGTHAVVTDSLIEMFKAKASASSTPVTAEPAPIASGSLTPTGGPRLHFSAIGEIAAPLMSPSNMFHPAHSSPHVHKTRLYSPYSTNGHSTPRHGAKKDAPAGIGPARASSTELRKASLPPPRIRPLADMSMFLGAVFNEDGSVASQIRRSALGLPGIKSFDTLDGQPIASTSALAGSCCGGGGGGGESADMDIDDVPVQFPTSEDVVLGGCACGEVCKCPNCLTHGNGPASPSSTASGDTHRPHDGCGDGCKSSFDCTHHLSLPSGIASIEQLIAIAASQVPDNPHPRPKPTELDPHDTRVLAPAAMRHTDAARHAGIVSVLPLERCNGRCQCPPGTCSCPGDCCGCCVECACDHDGDARMGDESRGEEPAPAKGCCGSGSAAAPPPASPSTASLDSPTIPPVGLARPARASGASTPVDASPAQPPLRRAASVSRAKEASNAPPSSSTAMARRTSLSHPTVQRSSSVSKANPAKAAANHAHPHPRPILPKPPSASGVSRLAGQMGASKQHSPAPSRSGSPLPRAVAGPSSQPAGPESVGSSAGAALEPAPRQVGVEDLVNTLSQTNGDLMAYISQYLSSADLDAGESALQTDGFDFSAPAIPNHNPALTSASASESSSGALLSATGHTISPDSIDAPAASDAFDFAAYLPAQPPSLTNDSSASSEVFDPANVDISELLAGALADPALVSSLLAAGGGEAQLPSSRGAASFAEAGMRATPASASLPPIGPNPEYDFNYHFWLAPGAEDAPVAPPPPPPPPAVSPDIDASSPTADLIRRLLQPQSPSSQPRPPASAVTHPMPPGTPQLFAHGMPAPLAGDLGDFFPSTDVGGPSKVASGASGTATWSFAGNGEPAPPVNILGPVAVGPPTSPPVARQDGAPRRAEPPAFASPQAPTVPGQSAPYAVDAMARAMMFGMGACCQPASARPPPPGPREPARPAPAPQARNPDLIDLSKPLQPGDVDRILQVILRQQAQQRCELPPAPAPAPEPRAASGPNPHAPAAPAPAPRELREPAPEHALGSVLDAPMAGLDMSSFDGELAGEFGEFGDYVFDDGAGGSASGPPPPPPPPEPAQLAQLAQLAAKPPGALGSADAYALDRGEFAGYSQNFLGRVDGAWQ